MFGRMKLVRKISNLEDQKTVLEDDKNKLQMELDRLGARYKTEEQELKHMIKMKEERAELELDREKLKLTQEKDEEVAKVKDQFRDKMEARLMTEGENIKEMYGQILERLPNISAKLEGKM